MRIKINNKIQKIIYISRKIKDQQQSTNNNQKSKIKNQKSKIKNQKSKNEEQTTQRRTFFRWRGSRRKGQPKE
jgi:hypothetical protein